MLDIQFIKENKEIVAEAIKNKNVKAEIDLDALIALYEKRLDLKKQVDEINRQKNEAAKMRNIEEGIRLKDVLPPIEEELANVTKQFMSVMALLPNVPSPDTPIGPDESGNKIIREWGEKPIFDFEPKEHFDLGRELGIIDNETATEVSGPRFTYLKGDLVLLQFAISQFLLETLTNRETLQKIAADANINVDTRPFIPVIPPVMIKPAVYSRMDRLEPKEDRYYIPSDIWNLIIDLYW